MKVPPEMLNSQLGGLVVAITELPDKRLVMMMDVEKVLADTGNFGTDDAIFKNIPKIGVANRTVFYVDDSPVARKQIARTLDAIGVNYIVAVNGNKAWEELKRLADSADLAHIPVSNVIQLILTDVEMPEMDGYICKTPIFLDFACEHIPIHFGHLYVG